MRQVALGIKKKQDWVAEERRGEKIPALLVYYLIRFSAEKGSGLINFSINHAKRAGLDRGGESEILPALLLLSILLAAKYVRNPNRSIFLRPNKSKIWVGHRGRRTREFPSPAMNSI